MLRLLFKYSITFLLAYLVSALAARAALVESDVSADPTWSEERAWYRDAV